MGDQTVSVKVNMEGRNMIIAYLLWWFLGWAGIHRFYLNRVGSGVAQLMLFIVGVSTLVLLIGYLIIIVWFVWWALDAFFTYRMVVKENKKLGVESSKLSLTSSGIVQSELDQLEKLHRLFEKGVITKEQYEAKKSELL